MNLSVIIPVLNEAANIQACLAALQSSQGHGCEIIVVDGGSNYAVGDTLTFNYMVTNVNKTWD